MPLMSMKNPNIQVNATVIVAMHADPSAIVPSTTMAMPRARNHFQ